MNRDDLRLLIQEVVDEALERGRGHGRRSDSRDQCRRSRPTHHLMRSLRDRRSDSRDGYQRTRGRQTRSTQSRSLDRHGEQRRDANLRRERSPLLRQHRRPLSNRSPEPGSVSGGRAPWVTCDEVADLLESGVNSSEVVRRIRRRDLGSPPRQPPHENPGGSVRFRRAAVPVPRQASSVRSNQAAHHSGGEERKSLTHPELAGVPSSIPGWVKAPSAASGWPTTEFTLNLGP